jgi:hypothetical protein
MRLVTFFCQQSSQLLVSVVSQDVRDVPIKEGRRLGWSRSAVLVLNEYDTEAPNAQHNKYVAYRSAAQSKSG